MTFLLTEVGFEKLEAALDKDYASHYDSGLLGFYEKRDKSKSNSQSE